MRLYHGSGEPGCPLQSHLLKQNRICRLPHTGLFSSPQILSEMAISDEAYKAYTEGMYLVCHGNDGVFVGTAYDTFKYYPINVCGKTGTADTEISYAGLGSANGAFICFAPMEDPQIAICIYGERVGHGNTLAAAAKPILDAYFEVGEAADVTTYENEIS